jgi:hypothetical protein
MKNLQKIHKKLFPDGEDKFGIYPLLKQKTTTTLRQKRLDKSLDNSRVEKSLKEQLEALKHQTYKTHRGGSNLDESLRKIKVKTAVGSMRKKYGIMRNGDLDVAPSTMRS